MTPFREWCKKRHIGPTTGYKLANSGQLKLKKVGKRSFVTDEEDERFIANLPEYQPRTANFIK